MFSSAHDLVRFGMFHLKAHLRDQKAILSDASIDEMHRPTTQGEGGYGIGFGVEDKDGYHVVSHTGGMGGVATSLRIFPQERLAIVVLSNSSSGLPFDIANRIAARMLPKWKVPDPHEHEEGEAQSPPFATPESLRGKWKGVLSTYVKEVPVELDFLPGGEVHAKIGDQLVALVNQPQFEKDTFSGSLAAHIGTPDTERYQYTISLSLRLRGEVLNGSATAVGADNVRVRNGLTHWVELKREPGPG